VFSQLRQGDVEPVEDWSTWYAEYRLGLRWRTSSRPASCSPPSGGNSSARSIIADVRTTARTPVFQEPANLATELYLDELDESVADDLRDRLAALKRAEQRLAGGTYGLTVESGRPIPDERLEVFPAAERTVEEERALDERGAS
jgi:DnaK suppressor protein